MSIDKVLVTGDRTWEAKDIILKVLRDLKPKLVIQGGAHGADTLARMCAALLKIPSKEYMANWTKYGRAAGPLRNREMIDKEKPELVLAFHDNLAKSKGTKNMVMLANNRGVPVYLYNSSGEVQYNYTIL